MKGRRQKGRAREKLVACLFSLLCIAVVSCSINTNDTTLNVSPSSVAPSSDVMNVRSVLEARTTVELPLTRAPVFVIGHESSLEDFASAWQTAAVLP